MFTSFKRNVVDGFLMMFVSFNSKTVGGYLMKFVSFNSNTEHHQKSTHLVTVK
jgi:hypothetical protein